MSDTVVGKIEQLTTRPAVGASELKALLGWRQIASAPKDGTRIMVFSTERGIVEVAKFFDAALGSERWLGDEGEELSYIPAFWMPLPQPPNAPHERAAEGGPLDAVVGPNTEE